MTHTTDAMTVEESNLLDLLVRRSAENGHDFGLITKGDLFNYPDQTLSLLAGGLRSKGYLAAWDKMSPSDGADPSVVYQFVLTPAALHAKKAEPRDGLRAVLADLGVTSTARLVRDEVAEELRSGKRDKDNPAMHRWEVTLNRPGRAPWVVAYSTGGAYRVWKRNLLSYAGPSLIPSEREEMRAGEPVGQRWWSHPRTQHKNEAMLHYSVPALPSTAAVVAAVVGDAQSWSNARTFEEWARGLGFNEDSRKAEAMWRACGESARLAGLFFGPDLPRVAEAANDF